MRFQTPVKPHRLLDLEQRLLALLARPQRAVVEQLVDKAGLRLVVGAALAHRVEEVVERLGQLLLDLDVAHLARAVALLEVLHFGHIGVEDVVVGEDRVALDRAGNVRANAGGVGVHAHHPPRDGLGVVAEEDGVVEALAHLGLAVGAHQRAAHDIGIRLGKTSP